MTQRTTRRSLAPLDDSAEAPSRYAGPGRFVLYYVRRWHWHFIALFASVTLGAAAAVGVQYLLKVLVDAMAGPPGLGSRVLGPLVLVLCLVAGESLLGRLTGWLACRTTVGIGEELRLDLFACLGGQSMRFFAENLAGSLGQRITATAGNFGALTNTFVWRVLPPIIDFCGALIIFATIDWRMGLALAVFVVAVTAGLMWFGERGRKRHRSYSGLAATNTGDLVDVLGNMWTVKAFCAREREWRRLSRRFRAEASAQRSSWMYLEQARLLHDLALWVMAGAMLSWVVVLWSRGSATPGDVVVIFGLTFRVLHSSRDMALSLVDIAQQFGFIEETLAVAGKARSLSDHPEAVPLRAACGTITFAQVGFSYGGGRNALHGVSLSVPRGTKLGIVGPSGAGKSTLIQLLQRLHDPTDGRILIGGQDIAQVTQASLREQLAVVPQEIGLLHRTVIDNIRFARPSASEEEVVAAARAACCDGFVRALPQGYHTLVGERGVKLSGGQRQRVGIARAFLKRAPIVLLDEATSALDTESEIEIHEALLQLMHDRTIIAVAHRLSTLAAFDRIIVIDGGRIVEDSTAADLRRKGGLFARMWRLQAEGLAAPLVDDAA